MRWLPFLAMLLFSQTYGQSKLVTPLMYGIADKQAKIATLRAAAEMAPTDAEKQEFTTALNAEKLRYRALLQAEEDSPAKIRYRRYPAQRTPEDLTKRVRHERLALLNYAFGEQLLHIFFITRKHIDYRVIPAGDELRQHLQQFRKLLETAPDTADVEGFAGHAYALYEYLLAPVDDLLQSIDQLIVIADREVAAVPLEALLRQPGKPGLGYAALHYFQRDFSISYAQSLIDIPDDSTQLTHSWIAPPKADAQLAQGHRRYLKEGLQKDQALREARLAYLAEVDGLEGHPHFWASERYFGDVSPTSEPYYYPWWIVLLAGFVLILAFGKKI